MAGLSRAARRSTGSTSCAPSSAIEAARVNARALGLMLHEVGVNVDCLPMLDVRQPGATDIVGDRALGSEPMQVAALGRAMLDGLASAGVLGVIKHIPGHGRALVDSHHELPVVDASEEELAVDLEPFERLRDAPMGMTATFSTPPGTPIGPPRQSPIVIHDIIRQRIGFDGFLMSDDIGMEALAGDHGQRAAACVAAGCDVALHCDGKMENMLSGRRCGAATCPPKARRGWPAPWRCASRPTTKWISPRRGQARCAAGAGLAVIASVSVEAIQLRRWIASLRSQ